MYLYLRSAKAGHSRACAAHQPWPRCDRFCTHVCGEADAKSGPAMYHIFRSKSAREVSNHHLHRPTGDANVEQSRDVRQVEGKSDAQNTHGRGLKSEAACLNNGQNQQRCALMTIKCSQHPAPFMSKVCCQCTNLNGICPNQLREGRAAGKKEVAVLSNIARFAISI